MVTIVYSTVHKDGEAKSARSFATFSKYNMNLIYINLMHLRTLWTFWSLLEFSKKGLDRVNLNLIEYTYLAFFSLHLFSCTGIHSHLASLDDDVLNYQRFNILQ